MKINKKLLENAPQYDPFNDMPPDTQKKCELRAELAMIIYKYRAEQGLTQSQLAKSLGMTQSQISAVENGDCNLTIERIEGILSKLQYEVIIQPSDRTGTLRSVFNKAGWIATTGGHPSKDRSCLVFV